MSDQKDATPVSIAVGYLAVLVVAFTGACCFGGVGQALGLVTPYILALAGLGMGATTLAVMAIAMAWPYISSRRHDG